MSYLALDLIFLAVAAGLAALLARRASRPSGARRRPRTVAAVLAAGAALLVLTGVFDNAMIAVGLFGYAPEALTGLSVGTAPVEDFAYPVAAAVLVPALWRALTAGESRGTSPADAPEGAEGRRRAPRPRALRTKERP